MLSTSQLRLLSGMSKMPLRDLPLSELADRLEWSGSHTSRVISGLEGRGFVGTKTKDGQKTVALENARPVEQFSNLVNKFPHVDFHDHVSGSALRILYYLEVERTATELAELSGVSRATVYRRLDSLQHVGIVGKDHSQYALTDSFTPLSEFARSVAHHDHRREATRVAGDAHIIWEALDEYLLGSQSEVTDDRFHLTGPVAFEQYGIPLLTRDQAHYFRSERRSEVTPADLVCHTLLIDDSTRYRSYCLLLIAGRDITESALEERAAHYDREAEPELLEIVEELSTYLETSGDVPNDLLPVWKDFKETATDYDISV